VVSAAARGEQRAYFSFFMFTADLRPDDPKYRRVAIGHIQELTSIGYRGFDLPIAPGPAGDHGRELESYRALKQAFDEAGLEDVRFTTNVAATRRFDPTSAYREQRQEALAYLKSRVDITAALGGEIMAGPIVFPYNVYPLTDAGEALWSDALYAWVAHGYRRAQPIMTELADYAQAMGVKLAIEPVDHWETPAPNSVAEAMDFLAGVPSPQLGVCVDIAHCMLSGGGPESFAADIRGTVDAGRLHYVHISAPDRGAVHDSWIPWEPFLRPLLPRYQGPFLLETFNAIPVFCAPLRLTRRKFWIPGEDAPQTEVPDAYTIARHALRAFRDEVGRIESGPRLAGVSDQAPAG
jgi:sugar phosphate isomerase/epimerase